jgi:hypothetical protein
MTTVGNLSIRVQRLQERVSDCAGSHRVSRVKYVYGDEAWDPPEEGGTCATCGEPIMISWVVHRFRWLDTASTG